MNWSEWIIWMIYLGITSELTNREMKIIIKLSGHFYPGPINIFWSWLCAFRQAIGMTAFHNSTGDNLTKWLDVKCSARFDKKKLLSNAVTQHVVSWIQVTHTCSALKHHPYISTRYREESQIEKLKRKFKLQQSFKLAKSVSAWTY